MTKPLKIATLFLFPLATTCLSLHPLFGQEYLHHFTHYSVEEGLSNRFIRTVTEDSRGLIWFGHKMGIERFDGRSFEEFFFDPPDAAFGNLSNIIEDPNGLLWILSSEGACRIFDPIKTEYLSFQDAFAGKCPFQQNEIKTCRKYDGKLWITTRDGKCYLYGKDFKKMLELPFTTPRSTCAYPAGGEFFWVNEGHKLTKIDASGNQVMEYVLPYPIKEIFTDEKGLTWTLPDTRPFNDSLAYIKNDSLHYLVFSNPAAQLIAPDVPDPLKVFYDKNGNPCVQFYGALIFYSPQFEELYNITERAKELEEIYNSLWTTFDRQGNIWLGTYDGVFLLTEKPNYFTIFQKGESIRGIAEAQNGLIYSNIYSKGLSQIIQKDGTLIGDWEHPKTDNRTCLFADDDGTLWTGQHQSLILHYWPDENRYEEIAMEDSFGKETYFIHRDSKIEKLWAGTRAGLGYIDEKTKTVKQFEVLPLMDESAYCIHENAEGLWIGIGNGLAFLDPVTNSVLEYPNIVPCPVYHIHEDRDGVLWLSTNGCGLVAWDKEKGMIAQYDASDGFSSNYVHAAYEGGENVLWLPSDYGLMRFNKSTKNVDVFMPGDGISHEEFNSFSHCRASDGRLWLGGLNGINVFRPEEVKLHGASLPPILFTKIEILKGNKWVALPNELEEVTLYVEDRSLNVYFSILDYLHPNSIMYAYKLVGINADWQFTKDNSLRFSSLAPGDYQLLIKGQGAGGIWAGNELTLKIKVFGPFYETWQFFLASFLLLSIFAFFLMKYLVNEYRERELRLEEEVEKRSVELKSKNEQLEKLHTSKDQLFAVIAHDTKNALITCRGVSKKTNYLIAEKQYDRLLKMGTDLDEASHNIESILDNLLNWAISEQGEMPYHPEYIDLKTLVDQTFDMYYGRAVAKGIKLESQVPNGSMVYIDPSAFGVIFRNLISNAIKYTMPGESATITFDSGKKGFAELIIEDRGVGIEPEKLDNLFKLNGKQSARGTDGEKGSGIGLLLCKLLIEQNKGKIRVESTYGVKSRFILEIPEITPEVVK